jgi:hypothetical protein
MNRSRYAASVLPLAVAAALIGPSVIGETNTCAGNHARIIRSGRCTEFLKQEEKAGPFLLLNGTDVKMPVDDEMIDGNGTPTGSDGKRMSPQAMLYTDPDGDGSGMDAG